MGIKIPFTNNYDTWRIATPRDPEAYQLDDNAHKLSVVGDLPDGYVWTMYISVMGKYKDALLLTRDATGASTTLTAENLAYGDEKYNFQLVGVKGDITRRTNEVSVFIPKSLIDGDTDWPDRVGAFEEAQTAVLGALAKSPYIDETTETWFVWSAAANAYVDTGVIAKGDPGADGVPGVTLGWDVTDDGVGNVEMTYPGGADAAATAVRFEEQTLTGAQQEQARENIGAASAADVDDLTDTAAEHDAEITALENLSNNQASSDSVLELAARDISTVASDEHMSFSLNDDGTFSIYGENSTSGDNAKNAIFYTSAAAIASAAAQTPPAGVYRLEISADQAADFSAVWGVVYIGNANRFVITDATGKSVEIYLDGNTPVSSGIVVGPGKNANGLKLTIALRRVGMPEVGELLVDQINQMQALQRKALSMLDTLRRVYVIANNVDKGIYSAPRVVDVTDTQDLNSIGKPYYVTMVRYNVSTLHSPYSDGVTSRTSGMVIDFHGGTNIGVQVGFPAGDNVVVVRKLYQSVWDEHWSVLSGEVTNGT